MTTMDAQKSRFLDKAWNVVETIGQRRGAAARLIYFFYGRPYF